jgi:hypothetical protein
MEWVSEALVECVPTIPCMGGMKQLVCVCIKSTSCSSVVPKIPSPDLCMEPEVDWEKSILA